ncbi:hypothetical protein BJ986_000198 [Phycicoccus badiiscoriae]|uniref:Uncharacterized protein n=1 Tax=Pedococcus badiiscoriae TaxID=642776 RepID=A0A852WE76_9MICO|nr:hypothetical protein [Pedococcus badiiscoriae]
MRVVDIEISDALVRDIVKDPEAYVEETRRRTKSRAKNTRLEILQTVGASKSPATDERQPA